MKIYKTEQVKYEKEVIDKLICDLCKREAKTPSKDWSAISYEIAEVIIKYRFGESYPESGSGETFSFDICPDCFKQKLIPWFKSQEVEPQKTESFW